MIKSHTTRETDDTNAQESESVKIIEFGMELEVTCNNDIERYDEKDHESGILPKHTRDCEDTRVDKSLPLSPRQLQTCFLAAVYFGLGMYRSQEGATFLDLLIVVDTNIEKGTIIQTSGNLGYMCGCLLSGFLVSNTDSDLLCFVLAALAGLLNISVPFCSILPLMAVVMFLRNVFVGTIMSSAICLCAKLWKLKAGPYLQTLMLLAAVGGFVCPLITEPFLRRRLDFNLDTLNSTNISLHLNKWRLTPTEDKLQEAEFNETDAKPMYSNELNNHVRYEDGLPERKQDRQSGPSGFSIRGGTYNCSRDTNAGNFHKGDCGETKVHWSFLITGLYGILTSLPFLIKFIRKGERALTREPRKTNSKRRRQHVCCSLAGISFVRISTYVCIGVILFSYGSTEKICHIFTMPFVVRYLNWSKAEGSQILAGYWAGFAMGRLLGIIQAHYLSASKIIVIDLILMVAGQLVLFVGTLGLPIVFWIACVALGLGMGSCYGAILSWVALNVAPLSGKLTAYCTTSFSLGIIVQLSLLGFLFENKTPMWFVYLSVTYTLLLIVSFIAMCPLVSSLKRNRN